MSDNVYNALKWIAQILLPALATLYFALSKIWGLPYPDQIVGTIMAVDAFLGLLLNLSNNTYKAVNRPELEYNPSPQTAQPYLILEREEGIFIKMTNELYDVLKWVAQILLPSVGTFAFAVAQIWGIPQVELVVGTIAAVDVFLGAILGISTDQYNREISAQILVEDGLHIGDGP